MINFTCECGKSFSLEDKHAGKKGKCPQCQRPINIPIPKVNLEIKRCGNCDRAIGKLEDTFDFRGGKICFQCNELLSKQKKDSLDTGNQTFVQNIVTIQKTAKKWKLLKAIGLIATICSFIILFSSFDSGGEPSLPCFIFPLGIGILMLIVGTCGKWWYHD